MATKHLIACAVVIDEIKDLLPPDMGYHVLDFGLHMRPDDLRKTLQTAIDSVPEGVEKIILGYGLCSHAVIGIKSDRCSLTVPRVDDCIAMFLGSRERYCSEIKKEPGTYYLTKGWIEVNDTLLLEYKRLETKYGAVRAHRMMNALLKNYKRIIFINTGKSGDLEKYQRYSEELAAFFKLKYEEVSGSDKLLRKLISCQWDNDFIVASPGHVICYDDFKS